MVFLVILQNIVSLWCTIQKERAGLLCLAVIDTEDVIQPRAGYNFTSPHLLLSMTQVPQRTSLPKTQQLDLEDAVVFALDGHQQDPRRKLRPDRVL